MSTHGGEAAWQVDGCDDSNNLYDLSTMCRALSDLCKLIGDAARFFREHFDLMDEFGCPLCRALDDLRELIGDAARFFCEHFDLMNEFGCLLAAAIRQSAIDLGNSRCLRPCLSIGTS